MHMAVTAQAAHNLKLTASCCLPPHVAPAATAAEVLKAVAEKQGWHPVDSLLRLEGKWEPESR